MPHPAYRAGQFPTGRTWWRLPAAINAHAEPSSWRFIELFNATSRIS
jgi:hypothetical protein